MLSTLVAVRRARAGADRAGASAAAAARAGARPAKRTRTPTPTPRHRQLRSTRRRRSTTCASACSISSSASIRRARWRRRGGPSSAWPVTSTPDSSRRRETASASSRTRARSPAATSPNTPNRYGWVFLGDLLAPAINTRGEVADLGEFARHRAVRQRRLRRRARLHHQRGQPDAERGAGATALATASVNFMPRSGARLQHRRLHRGRPRAAGMDADASRADVDLRRQVRLRHRHRVPRAQGHPAFRHHALADRALHDRHADRRSRCAASSSTSDRVVIAAALTNGSSTTEQFHFYDEIDSNAGKTASGRLSVEPLPAARPRDRPVGRVRRAGPRARQPRPALVRGAWTCSATSAGRHQGAVPARRGGRRARRPHLRSDHRPYGLDLKQRRLPRGRLDDHAAHRRATGAASCATRWSGWQSRQRTGRG